MIYFKFASLVLIVSLISLFRAEPITNKCRPGKILKNVILEGGTKVGKYIEANDVEKDIDCGIQCCSNPQCDLGFILGSKCFLVICKDYDSCQIAQARDTSLNPRLIFVTRKNDEGVLRSIFSDDQKPPWNPNICPPMVKLTKVTVKRGIGAGEFTDIGPVPGIEQCYDICCQKDDCDLAFVLAANCFTVKCHNDSSRNYNGCSLDTAVESPFNPEAAHMLSRINQHENMGSSMGWQESATEKIIMTTAFPKVIPQIQPIYPTMPTVYKIPNPDPIPLIQDPNYYNPFQIPYNYPYMYGYGSKIYPTEMPPKPNIAQAVSEVPKEIMRGYFMVEPGQLMAVKPTTLPYHAPQTEMITNDIFEDSGCKFEPKYKNSSLKNGKKAGIFIKASSNVKDLVSCIWSCCSAVNDTFRCELILWVSDKCYLVDCFNESSCEKRSVPSNYDLQIVYVRDIVSNIVVVTTQIPKTTKRLTTPIPHNIIVEPENTTAKPIIEAQELQRDAKIMTKCGRQEILWNMTVEGASATVDNENFFARNFATRTAKLLESGVNDMVHCTELCCHDDECDAAVLQETRCLSVSCSKNPRACMPIVIKSPQKRSHVAFMSRTDSYYHPTYFNYKTIFIAGIGVASVLLISLFVGITVISVKLANNRKHKPIPRKSTKVSRNNSGEIAKGKSDEEKEQDRLEELLSKVSASFARNKHRQ